MRVRESSGCDHRLTDGSPVSVIRSSLCPGRAARVSEELHDALTVHGSSVGRTRGAKDIVRRFGLERRCSEQVSLSETQTQTY
jgi:hypothetical protein